MASDIIYPVPAKSAADVPVNIEQAHCYLRLPLGGVRGNVVRDDKALPAESLRVVAHHHVLAIAEVLDRQRATPEPSFLRLVVDNTAPAVVHEGRSQVQVRQAPQADQPAE